jgi:hypothetical protein
MTTMKASNSISLSSADMTHLLTTVTASNPIIIRLARMNSLLAIEYRSISRRDNTRMSHKMALETRTQRSVTYVTFKGKAC